MARATVCGSTNAVWVVIRKYGRRATERFGSRHKKAQRRFILMQPYRIAFFPPWSSNQSPSMIKRSPPKAFSRSARTFAIRIRVCGFELRCAAKMVYRYKLESFDKNWVDAGTQRTAYYTNIPPGRYKFKVLARNNDGLWNETGASLSFRRNPVFIRRPGSMWSPHWD